METEKIPYTGPLADHLRTHLEKADSIIAKGGAVFWKFTCAHCGSRQTFDEPNALFMTGTCEECGKVTDLQTAAANPGFDALLTL
jgi:ribosomal protein S27E